MTILEKIKFEEDWLSEVNLTKENIEIALAGIRATALEQEDVIRKAKAEILDEAEYAYADFDKYKEDVLHADSDELPNDDFRYGLHRAIEIINKYKTESEANADE